MGYLRIACEGAGLVELDALVPTQGELKSLSTENYARLRKEIEETGFAFPFHVWRNAGVLNLIGGHQRLRVLKQMKQDGWHIPLLPAVWVTATDLREAMRRVLQDVSQYGRIENQGLYEFMTENEIPIDELISQYRLPDINYEDFSAEYFKDTNPSGDGSGEAGEEGAYSMKVESPIYTPKGEKPAIEELYDQTKLEELLQEIEDSELPEKEKAFLRIAAERHVVFDYENIAEFYAHASPELQKLMEASALVIIDFEQAIEHGFVKMTEKIAETYKADARGSDED